MAGAYRGSPPADRRQSNIGLTSPLRPKQRGGEPLLLGADRPAHDSPQKLTQRLPRVTLGLCLLTAACLHGGRESEPAGGAWAFRPIRAGKSLRRIADKTSLSRPGSARTDQTAGANAAAAGIGRLPSQTPASLHGGGPDIHHARASILHHAAMSLDSIRSPFGPSM
jgi:hypothetical protein